MANRPADNSSTTWWPHWRKPRVAGSLGVRELLDGPVGKPAETNRAEIGEAWKGYRSVARTLARTNRGQDRRQAAAWEQQQQNQAQPAQPEPAQPVPPEPTQPEPAQPEPVQTTAQQELGQPEPTTEPVQPEPAAGPNTQVIQPETKVEPENSTKEELEPVAAEVPRNEPSGGSRVITGVRSEREEPPEGKPALEAPKRQEPSLCQRLREQGRPTSKKASLRPRRSSTSQALRSRRSCWTRWRHQHRRKLRDLRVSSRSHKAILGGGESQRGEQRQGHACQQLNRVSRANAVRSGHPAFSTPPTSVGEQLEVVLDLCDKIQGALSQQPETPLVGAGTSSDQAIQQDGSASGKPAAVNCRWRLHRVRCKR